MKIFRDIKEGKGRETETAVGKEREGESKGGRERERWKERVYVLNEPLTPGPSLWAELAIHHVQAPLGRLPSK